MNDAITQIGGVLLVFGFAAWFWRHREAKAKPLYRISLDQQRSQVLRDFLILTERNALGLVRGGAASGRHKYQLYVNLGVVTKVLKQLNAHPGLILLNDARLAHLAYMMTTYILLGRYSNYANAPREQIDVLNFVLAEIERVGPKDGPWSINLAINNADKSLLGNLTQNKID